MEWSSIEAMLPCGWERKCYELEAMQRNRKIKSPKELLEMVFTYLTVTESLNMTAGLMQANDVSISKVALFKRLKASGEWLKWMLKSLIESTGLVITKPTWLGGKNVHLVDGSLVSLKGSRGADYRLHMMFDLFNYCYKDLDITTIKDGEKISKFKIENNSIIIGDRGFVSAKGIEYVLQENAHYIFRWRARAFNLYDFEGKKLDLSYYLGGLGDFEHKTVNCQYLFDGQLKPIKICIMKKDEKAILSDGKRLKNNFSQKEIEAISEDTKELNKYIVLCTNLEYEAEKIFELYRCRWQVELIFKELKSVLSFGDIPSSNEGSVKAWFYGKLLIAALSLLMLNESHFSPKD